MADEELQHTPAVEETPVIERVPRKPRQPPPDAERLGHYALLRRLAEGGMGQVYLAQRDGSERICVLKTLRPDLLDSETTKKRFVREAQLAAYLEHPNIARLLDAGFEDETFAIAFEFIAGKDVESMMHELLYQKRLLPFEASVSLMVGILDGLDFAHEAKDPTGRPLNIVHRDLSPRNMMLTFDGFAKVIDFGVARASLDDFKTAPGLVMGTFRYVSPEIAQAGPVDRRSDVYAAGVVLYELLSGVGVVQPRARAVEMLQAVILGSPEPLHQVNKAISASLSAAVMKAIEKDPSRRWQTAAEFRSAIVAAAPELAHFPRASLAQFLRTWFKEDAERASAIVELSALSEPGERTRTFVLDTGPPEEMVVPVDFEAMEVDLATKTGLVFPELPLSSGTQSVLVERTTMVPTRLVDRRDQPSQRPAPPPRRSGVWSHGASALLGAAAMLVVVWLLAPRTAPTVETLEVEPSVAASPAVSVHPMASPIGSLAPSAAPRRPSPAAPRTAPQSPPQASEASPAPRRQSELRRLFGALERSFIQPLSDDPSFEPFLTEARRVAGSAAPERAARVDRELRLFSAEPSVRRAQKLVEALEAE